MHGGTIVVTGNAGKDAGLGMRGGRILLGGEVGSVSHGVRMTPPNDEDKKLLLLLNQQYGIKKKAGMFDKIIVKQDGGGGEVTHDIELG